MFDSVTHGKDVRFDDSILPKRVKNWLKRGMVTLAVLAGLTFGADYALKETEPSAFEQRVEQEVPNIYPDKYSLAGLGGFGIVSSLYLPLNIVICSSQDAIWVLTFS